MSKLNFATLLAENLRSGVPRFVTAAREEFRARTKGLTTVAEVCEALGVSGRGYANWREEGLLKGLPTPRQQSNSVPSLIRHFVLDHPEGVTPAEIVDHVQERRPDVQETTIWQVLSKEYRAGRLHRTGVGSTHRQSLYYPPKAPGKVA